MSAKNVIVLSLAEGVVSDELAVRLRPGDALAAGRVDADDAVLGNVEVGRGLCAGLESGFNNSFHFSCSLTFFWTSALPKKVDYLLRELFPANRGT